MEMKRFCVLLIGILMLGLVIGAGYNIVVPAAVADTDTSSGGGGGGGVANVTTNASVVDEGDEEEDVQAGDEEIGTGAGVIGESVDSVVSFVKSISWKVVLVLLSGLLIVGGVVWYFLKDKRNGFVEIKVKKKK